MIWLKEHDQRLGELFLQGFSANEIARKLCAEFSHGFTRNSVIGRKHRLGLFHERKRRPPVVAAPTPKPLTEKWMPEHDAILREKREAAWPDHRIAEHLTDLGFPISRSGVRDRAVKLGCPRVKRADMPLRRVAQAEKPKPSALPLPPYISKEEAWLPIAESRRVQIHDTSRGLCYWPLWDGPSGGEYCGADTGDLTRTYCPAHQQLSMPKAKVAA